MLTRDDLLAAMLKECDICIHLHGKLPVGGLDYRPSPAQRSTRELLAYLPVCGIGMARALVDGHWEAYGTLMRESVAMDPIEFPVAMERQKEALRALFETLTDEELSTRRVTVPSGEEFSLAAAMLDLPYRSLCGYRMQLFLYAKAAGNHDLKTPNCWAGRDMVPE